MIEKIKPASSGVKRLAVALDKAERHAAEHPSDEARHELFEARNDYRRVLRQRALTVSVRVPADKHSAAKFYRELRTAVINAHEIKEACADTGSERERIEAISEWELLYTKLERTAEVIQARERAAARRERTKQATAARAARFTTIMGGGHV